jgi:hypothetical protein
VTDDQSKRNFSNHTTLTFRLTILFDPLNERGGDENEGRQGDKLSGTYETDYI